ncbi:hypothetical protein BJ912DRAFT_942981 [Pholiota molesta]|nr:hypothetical protein BJ912DRAFT_942981 [Pholiota molesta]
MFRTTATSLASRATVCTRSRRAFHASPAAQKTPLTEKVAEVADKVNRTVGKSLADALDKGEKATYKAKETLVSTAEQTKKKAEEAKRVIEPKADVEKKL